MFKTILVYFLFLEALVTWTQVGPEDPKGGPGDQGSAVHLPRNFF